MRIDILTLFPEMFTPLKSSILGRATANNLLDIRLHNFRDYSLDKHKKVDDYPFGGGAGMVLTPQPIFDCINTIDPEHKARRIYLSPKGRLFHQRIAEEYSRCEWLLFLCGHYEGVDQRVIDLCIDEELSCGDYVLTGGELPAMCVVDAVARLLDGVLGSSVSAEDESISSGVLEYPQYTRPAEFMGSCVPEVLLSGHHQRIDDWRREQSVKLTMSMRPDLLLRRKI